MTFPSPVHFEFKQQIFIFKKVKGIPALGSDFQLQALIIALSLSHSVTKTDIPLFFPLSCSPLLTHKPEINDFKSFEDS